MSRPTLHLTHPLNSQLVMLDPQVDKWIAEGPIIQGIIRKIFEIDYSMLNGYLATLAEAMENNDYWPSRYADFSQFWDGLTETTWPRNTVVVEMENPDLYIKPKWDYLPVLASPSVRLDKNKIYPATIAINQPDYEQKGLIFVGDSPNEILLGREDYEIIEYPHISIAKDFNEKPLKCKGYWDTDHDAIDWWQSIADLESPPNGIIPYRHYINHLMIVGYIREKPNFTAGQFVFKICPGGITTEIKESVKPKPPVSPPTIEEQRKQDLKEKVTVPEVKVPIPPSSIVPVPPKPPKIKPSIPTKETMVPVPIPISPSPGPLVPDIPKSLLERKKKKKKEVELLAI